MKKLGIWAALPVALAGCGTTVISDYTRPLVISGHRLVEAAPIPGRKLVVVIDGTSNDARDRTNATRLHELITNQDREDIAAFYTEGVGSDGRIIGLATGWGLAKDVRDAYRFLGERWQGQDRIYLFGFSRGAFAVRTLNDLIYLAGIPDFRTGKGKDMTRAQRGKLVDRVYDAYKNAGLRDDDRPIEDARLRSERMTALIDASGVGRSRDTRVRVMGLWDTVASMGKPGRGVDPMTESKGPYLDQRCNVDRVLHALALDDNRGVDFTPVLEGDERTTGPCPGMGGELDELWFSGAHADVGGTYADRLALDGQLPGVSLNWMLSRLAGEKLVPERSGQRSGRFDPAHDARSAIAVYKIRRPKYRTPVAWSLSPRYGPKVLRLHYSVEQRLEWLGEIDRLRRERSGNQPILLHLTTLQDYGLVAELLHADCLNTISEDSAPERVRGYTFKGERRPSGKPDVEVEIVCGPSKRRIVIVYDTTEQRIREESLLKARQDASHH